MRKSSWWLIVAAAFACSPVRAADPVLVFAAASLTNAFTDAGKAWAAAGHAPVRFSFASSSTLAKQVETGAPAAIFASADEEWMDYLAARKRIDAASRVDFAGNTLVLIVPSPRAGHVVIDARFDLPAFLGDGRLAVGDPDHVPAGKYARRALTSLGLWERTQPRLVRAEDVRAALAYVERAEVAAGIVYATDAAITPKVRIAGTFPPGSYPPIVYPMALVSANAGDEARAFLAFLAGPQARAIYARYGFSAP